MKKTIMAGIIAGSLMIGSSVGFAASSILQQLRQESDKIAQEYSKKTADFAKDYEAEFGDQGKRLETFKNGSVEQIRQEVNAYFEERSQIVWIKGEDRVDPQMSEMNKETKAQIERIKRQIDADLAKITE